MAKKAKPSVDKIVKKVNKEFEKTSAQIEGLINDALKQFDNLQNQVQEPVRKLLKDMDELRDREMKRFNDEFERRMNEFHELQSALLERLGIASKETGKSVSKSSESTSKASGTKKAAPAKKTAAAKPAAKKTSWHSLHRADCQPQRCGQAKTGSIQEPERVQRVICRSEKGTLKPISQPNALK